MPLTDEQRSPTWWGWAAARVTGDGLRAGRTARGGYSRTQLRAWGVPSPPPAGWPSVILGRLDTYRPEDAPTRRFAGDPVPHEPCVKCRRYLAMLEAGRRWVGNRSVRHLYDRHVASKELRLPLPPLMYRYRCQKCGLYLFHPDRLRAPRCEACIASSTDRAPLRRHAPRLVAETGGRCPGCRRPITVATAHVDHMTPIARGGTNARENLQALCARCNLSKGAQTMEEWRKRRRRRRR